ncbi:hypothetical protein UA08_08912 [Talaromyces atroroseus]|uniref:Transcription factor domain-containing protein n=1 Tax=Talaromyces atroroseus TaxID=1441469 RepID=A0A225ADC5_TALAT|nr:hypothetical protein UA08_08912 [Talaromyces atroroseus]OKL55924.1 hypothetical protein UA08_08912 [Talaromyces atroroseus]
MELNKGSMQTQTTTPYSLMSAQDLDATLGRRAMLAYFLLISQTSYAKQEILAPEWTPYLDEYLQTISKYPEWPGDEQLAAQIKIQLLVHQISQRSWKNQEFQPPASYLKGLQSQLEKIKAKLPRRLSQNVDIISQLLYSELAIQDAILTKPLVSLYIPNYQRQQLFETHLTTLTRIFDHFFIPQDQYSGVIFIRWCQMAHGLILLHRLYVLDDDPSWDQASARDHVGLFALGDRLTSILAETGASRGGARSDSNENMFIRFSRIIQSICSAWVVELQSSELRLESYDYLQYSTINFRFKPLLF